MANIPEVSNPERPETPTRAIRWPELIASIGVMLSLLFVGIQIRQNTAAIRVGTYQDLASQASDINLTLATDTMLAADYNLFRSDLTDSARASTRSLVLAIVRLSENGFYMGQLDAYDARWLARYESNPIYASINFSKWWTEGRERFAPDFRAHMDSIVNVATATHGQKNFVKRTVRN